MGTQGIVVQPGQGSVANYAPGRSIVLKLRCDETDGSIMMFEATAPVGAKSTLHLHHDSDEVADVLSGEITFLIGDEVTVGGPGACAFMPRGVRHAWKSTGAETGRVLFLYTPAQAGGSHPRTTRSSPWWRGSWIRSSRSRERGSAWGSTR